MSATTAVHQPFDTAMIWAKLGLDSSWGALSTKQKVFTVVYLATGDAIAATNAAYDMQSDTTARIFSYELLRAPKIAAALKVVLDPAEAAVFNDSLTVKHKTSRQRILFQLKRTLASVDRHLAEAEVGGTSAQRLLSIRRSLIVDIGNVLDPEMLGATRASSPTTKFEVGQKVTERDGAGRLRVGVVKSVDDQGQPIEIEEIHEEI